MFVHLRNKIMIINVIKILLADAEDDQPDLPTTNTTTENGACDRMWLLTI